LRRIFDRKISDKTTVGYNSEEIKNWLDNVAAIATFKYYYYPPETKRPVESKNWENQSTREVLSFLNSHFTESANFFVEIQHKVYKSGRHEVVLRGMDLKGVITKLAVLDFLKT